MATQPTDSEVPPTVDDNLVPVTDQLPTTEEVAPPEGSLYKPEISKCPPIPLGLRGPESVHEGSELRLLVGGALIVPGENGELPTIAWDKDGQPLILDERFSTSFEEGLLNVLVKSSLVSDSGEYCCHINTPDRQFSSFSVKVRVEPKSDVPPEAESTPASTAPEEVAAAAGTDVPQAESQPDNAAPADAVPSEEPTSTEVPAEAGAEQQPEVITPSHEEVPAVPSENKPAAGELIKVHLQPSELNVKEGEVVLIHGKLNTAAGEHLSVDWHKNGEKVINDSRVSGDNSYGVLTLLIRHALPSDSGSYSCGLVSIDNVIEANAVLLHVEGEHPAVVEEHPQESENTAPQTQSTQEEVAENVEPAHQPSTESDPVPAALSVEGEQAESKPTESNQSEPLATEPVPAEPVATESIATTEAAVTEPVASESTATEPASPEPVAPAPIETNEPAVAAEPPASEPAEINPPVASDASVIPSEEAGKENEPAALENQEVAN